MHMGADAPPQRGNRGLVAGCAFTEDILKAFLAQPLRHCPMGQPQDYVDDIMLQITEDDPGLCAAQLEAALGNLTTAFEADNMQLNTGKQQALGRTKVSRDAWDARGRRPDAVRLLIVVAGKWDPEVVRSRRLVKHWQKEAAHHNITPE